jgi:hypothetical protein
MLRSVVTARWGRRDLEDHLDLLVVHFYATYARQDDLPRPEGVGGVQPAADLLGERLQAADDPLHLRCGDLRRLLLGQLLLERGHALPQPGQPRRELLLGEQPVGVAVDEPRHPGPGPLELRAQRFERVRRLGRAAGEAALVLRRELRGVLKQLAHFPPDRRLQLRR